MTDEERRKYMREYMREWRRKNSEKIEGLSPKMA